VCSAQRLQRCLAVHRFVRSGEAAEVSEPPAVRDGGNGAVEGICGPQIPVGTAESDHADIRHRRHAQVTLESLSVRTLTWHCLASVEMVNGRCGPPSMMSIASRTAAGRPGSEGAASAWR
jgi:hypothetical protein